MTAQAPAWRQEVPSDEDAQLYTSDDFRIWCMKVIPCTKRYVHDWSVCPFAHAGEKAVRRDPRTHEYTGIACPEMKRTGSCLRGDNCPYAHNVFEYWLHPTRYRTQLCNDGPGCSRSICFFAHNLDELRTPAVKPYVSPEALARSSLAAIQQNPHPLAQQLASPFRTGSGSGGGAAAGPAGRGRSSGDGAAAPPFSARPGPGAAQQQGPWGTAAARLGGPQSRQAGQPAAWHDGMGPATPRQIHQPQQPLRLSADYPTYIPAQGSRGAAAGFLSVGQAGPSMGHYGGPAAAAAPVTPVGGGLQAGPSGMGSWVDAQQQGGMGLGVAATPGAWSGVGMPAGRGSWGAQDPYAAPAGTGVWISQGAGAIDPTAALQAALRLSSSSMSAESAADMAALARGMSDASTHGAALLQAVLSGRMSGSSTSEGIDPSALADAVALANRLSDASMGAASALSDRLSSESLLASAVGTPSSRLLTGQQGMGTAGEAAAAAAAGLAAHQLPSAAQEAAAGGAALGPEEPGFAGPLQRYGSNVSLGASRRSIGGRSSRGSGDVAAEDAATMAPQEQMPGTAPEEGLAQALANMKMALTHQQLAATTSTNHEVVISTLHQVLRDAAAQHASNMGQGAEAGADTHP